MAKEADETFSGADSVRSTTSLNRGKSLGTANSPLSQLHRTMAEKESVLDSARFAVADHKGKKQPSAGYLDLSAEQARNDCSTNQKDDGSSISCLGKGKRKSSDIEQKTEMIAHCKRRIVELTAPLAHRVKKKPPRKVVDHTYHDLTHVSTKNIEPVAIRDEEDTSDRYFVPKLHKVLSDPAYKKILSWQPHGRAFRIHNVKMLEKEVCAKHFGHSRYSSFLRQLNNASFKFLTKGEDSGCYYHQAFLRGMPHLTEYMPIPLRSRRKLNPDPENEPDLYDISRRFPLPDSQKEEKAPPGDNSAQSSGLPICGRQSSFYNKCDIGTDSSPITDASIMFDHFNDQEKKKLVAPCSNLAPLIPECNLGDKAQNNDSALSMALQILGNQCDSKDIGAIGMKNSHVTNGPTTFAFANTQEQKRVQDSGASLLPTSMNRLRHPSIAHAAMLNASAPQLLHPSYGGGSSVLPLWGSPTRMGDARLGLSIPASFLAQPLLHETNPTPLPQSLANISNPNMQANFAFSQQDKPFNG